MLDTFSLRVSVIPTGGVVNGGSVCDEKGNLMVWYGKQKGEGFEYYLLALGIAITLIKAGARAGSLDGAHFGRW